MVRFLPLPASETPLDDIRFVFSERAVMLIWLAAISSSTLNGIAPLEVSSAIITFVLTFENVGFAFVAARTWIWNVRTVVGPPSEAVTVTVADPVAPTRTDMVIEPEVAPGV